MNKAFNIKKYTDVLLIISIVILALTLISMIVLGFFAHPLGDDFYYGELQRTEKRDWCLQQC